MDVVWASAGRMYVALSWKKAEYKKHAVTLFSFFIPSWVLSFSPPLPPAPLARKNTEGKVRAQRFVSYRATVLRRRAYATLHYAAYVRTYVCVSSVAGGGGGASSMQPTRTCVVRGDDLVEPR